jgi:AcrR family transcriptional regulator
MARWEPDARGRLEKAAMDLFVERGYEHTTVGDIAARAELTERTFFRYFADKREVLFSGSKDLEQLILDHIASAPHDQPPLDVLVGAYAAAGAWLEDLRAIDYVRARWALVAKHAEIQERELIKMAGLAASTARALVARGESGVTANLAAELGIAVFKNGFERWLAAKKPRDFGGHVRAALVDLRAVAAPPAKRARRAER